MRNIHTPDLEDPEILKGIVLSLRMAIDMHCGRELSPKYLEDIAYAKDKGTVAMIEAVKTR